MRKYLSYLVLGLNRWKKSKIEARLLLHKVYFISTTSRYDEKTKKNVDYLSLKVIEFNYTRL